MGLYQINYNVCCLGLVRWHAERRAAMSSMLEYAQRGVALQLVWAGHEPQEFINYFPQWTLNEDVQFYNREVGLTCLVRNKVSPTDSIVIVG